MSEEALTTEASIRECLDRQLALALENRHSALKLSIPKNSTLARGVPNKASITLEEASVLCSAIENKAASGDKV